MARTPDAEPVRRDVGVGLTSDARSKKDDAAPRQSPWDMRGANASANRRAKMTLSYVHCSCMSLEGLLSSANAWTSHKSKPSVP